MTAIYFDSPNPDELRRQRLYQGELYVFSPRPSTIALRNHAREMIEEAFDGIDPEFAQYSLPVEEYVAIGAPLKPAFIHHPKTKQLIQKVLEDLRCDMLKTYLDVPRLRLTTSDGYLTAGVGYAFQPHRDTWYSAPMCQLNWWLPIYDFEAESAMAFHPVYWDRPVKNGSSEFNYYDWNRQGRKGAAQHIHKDTRKQPYPEEPINLDPQIRVVCPAGGIVLFSPAHLHSTVPNTSGRTRYSMDFRTVHWDDVVVKAGAPNLDSEPTGTSLRDFMRGTDLAPFPSEVLELYETETPTGDLLVFRP
jgi:Phytanoyl-CoA dioxygenase (PhyH)